MGKAIGGSVVPTYELGVRVQDRPRLPLPLPHRKETPPSIDQVQVRRLSFGVVKILASAPKTFREKRGNQAHEVKPPSRVMFVETTVGGVKLLVPAVDSYIAVTTWFFWQQGGKSAHRL